VPLWLILLNLLNLLYGDALINLRGLAIVRPCRTSLKRIAEWVMPVCYFSVTPQNFACRIAECRLVKIRTVSSRAMNMRSSKLQWRRGQLAQIQAGEQSLDNPAPYASQGFRSGHAILRREQWRVVAYCSYPTERPRRLSVERARLSRRRLKPLFARMLQSMTQRGLTALLLLTARIGPPSPIFFSGTDFLWRARWSTSSCRSRTCRRRPRG